MGHVILEVIAFVALLFLAFCKLAPYKSKIIFCERPFFAICNCALLLPSCIIDKFTRRKFITRYATYTCEMSAGAAASRASPIMCRVCRRFYLLFWVCVRSSHTRGGITRVGYAHSPRPAGAAGCARCQQFASLLCLG